MRICTCPSSASALGKVLARIRCAVCASVVTFGTLSRPGRAFGSWRGERVCLQGFVCKFNPSDCLSLACCSFFRALRPRSQFSPFVCVLFLGGVLRCQAPWLRNDGTQVPKLSEFTESQHQCSPRGQCSAEAPESGIDGSAGNTAEFKRPWKDTGSLQTATKLLDVVDLASLNAAWDMVMNKKEQVRDPSARATVLNSSRETVLPQ